MKKSTNTFASQVYLALVAVLAFGVVPNARSANRTWSGAISGANIHVWSANNNWGGQSWPTTPDTAIFTSVVGNSSTPKVTVNGLTIANLTFNSGAASFNIIRDTAARTLTVTGTVSQNAANPQTISVPLAGTAGLTKAGAGVLVLIATNTYSGVTTVNAGKLLGKAPGSISNSPVNVTAASATSAVQIASPGDQWACAGLTYSAAGDLGFDFNNGIAPDATTAPLQVNGDLAFTATPTVTILNNSIPSSTASYPLISYTGTASGTAPTAVTISPGLTGGATAAIRLDTGSKVVYLDVSAGVTPTKLAYTSLPATPQQGLPFSVTVQSQDAGGTVGNVTNDTTVTLSVGSGSGSLSGTMSGVISNGLNSVTIAGVIYSAADTMTLTATPTAGMTTLIPVTSGDIVFASEPTKLAYTAIPNAEVVGRPFNVTVQAQDSGGSPRGVTTDTTITLSKASGSGVLGGTTNGTITAGGDTVTISGVTYDTVEAMTLTASATAGMTLASVTSGSITFTPDTQTLHWGPNDANWTDTDAWYNSGTSNSATYNDVAPDAVVFEDTHSGTGDRTITLTTTVSPASVTMTADSKNFSLSGPGAIGGSTGLSKDGAGTLTLSTTNTFSGDTRIGAGTLTLGNSSALQNSTLDMNANDSGSLSFTSALGTATLGGLTGTRDITLADASSGGVTLIAGNNNTDTTYLGVLSGAGGFTKTGTGTFTWGDETNAPMTYSGETIISQGTVVISKTDLLPASMTTVDGTVLYGGAMSELKINALSGSGTITMGNAGATAPVLILGEGNGSGSFSGTIKRGTGATQNTVIKAGTGTLTLSGANSIGLGTGGFVINGGRVIVHTTTSALGAYGVTVNDPTGVGSATLELNNLALDPLNAQGLTLGTNAVLTASGGTGSYSRGNGGPAILNDAQVTFSTATSGDTLSIGSAVSGGNSSSLITAAGPGLVVLTAGSSGFAGKWQVTGGTLEVGASGSIQGNVTVANGAVFQADNNAAMAATATLTLAASPSPGTVNLNFGGTQTIHALYFGAAQQDRGPWGAVGSGATNESTAFTGTGILNVTTGPSSTVLASSANPAVYGALVLTATVTGTGGTPTGTVTFKEGANVLGTAPLVSGVASLNPGNALPPGGPYSLTAEYAGDANYTPSTSSPISQTVTAGELTIKADDKVKAYGGTAVLTFTPIGLASGDTVGSATLTCSEATDTNAVPGEYTIVPSAATGGTFNPADYSIIYSNGTLTVTKAPLTITGLNAQNKVYDGSTGATLSGTAGLSGIVGTDDVSLTGTASGAFADANVGTGKTVSVTGLSLTGADAGKYDLAPLTLTADITAAATTTALLSSQNPSEPGSSVTFTATVSSAAGTPAGDVVFKANTVPFSTNALVSGSAAASTSSLPVGTNTITTEYAAQGNYLGSTGSLDQVVKVLVTCSATNALVGIANNLDGTFTLTFVGTPQAEYYVLSSADVGALMTSWSPVPGSTNTVTDPGGVWQATVTNTAPAQFYRSAAVVPCP